VLLSLTEKGKAHLDAWHEQALSLVGERVALLDRDEKEALVRGLSALARAFPATPEQRED
jgi:DNA-binding MarR family transcriptional regulator